MDVCVIGLGYVGLTLAVFLAKKGYRVHGVDISPEVQASLKAGKAHFFERDFDNQLAAVLKDGTFTFGHTIETNETKLISNNTAYIVTVGTPLNSNKQVDLEPIRQVSASIAKVLKNGDLVILRSTVRIGVTREVVKPELDKSGTRYLLAFCPERTLEGRALEELSSLPQIISGIDESSLKAATAFFAPVSSKTISLHSLEEAEMVKLLNNSERDLMFAFANEVALMCDAKGLNAMRVISAANDSYPRSNLRKPGPVGGPCLEKDPYILAESFEFNDYQPQLLKTGRSINEDTISISLNRIHQTLKERLAGLLPTKIAVLGFAFKGIPPTSDLRGSLVFSILDSLKQHYPNAEIVGHDWLANPNEMHKAGVTVAATVTEALNNANLVILQNNHPNYALQDWTALSTNLGAGKVIFDFWNQIEPESLTPQTIYLGLGTIGADR